MLFFLLGDVLTKKMEPHFTEKLLLKEKKSLLISKILGLRRLPPHWVYVETKIDFGYNSHFTPERLWAIQDLAVHLINKVPSNPSREYDPQYLKSYLNSIHCAYNLNTFPNTKIKNLTEKIRSDKKLEEKLFEDLVYISDKDPCYNVRNLANDLINIYWIESLKIYRENPKRFMIYFSNLKDSKQKKNILKLISESNYRNKKIDDWLEIHESRLMKEINEEK